MTCTHTPHHTHKQMFLKEPTIVVDSVLDTGDKIVIKYKKGLALIL